jgi:hypothetical protein
MERKKKAHVDSVNRSRSAVALEARGTAMGSLGLVVFGLLLWQFVVDRSGLAGPACCVVGLARHRDIDIAVETINSWSLLYR